MEAKKIIIYLVILFILLCIAFLPGYSELQMVREENDQYLQRIKLLEGYNDKLKGELFSLTKDPDYLEKTARKKLGIVKKGEVIYRGEATAPED